MSCARARRGRTREPGASSVARAIAAAAAEHGLRGERVLVAASGGVDSTVLLDGLCAGADTLGIEVAAGHVNHGLRGAESDADEAAVADLAKHLGVPFASRRVDPRALRAAGPSRARPTLQEASRRLRHEALRELASALGCARIATAHTLDDQAETVLLRLLRGASPAGLGGIAPRSEDGLVVRPLLGVSRAEIERAARERGLSWREDASNRDPHYARGRLRASGFAALAASLNPQWLRAVGDLAEAQRKESAWVEEAVAREMLRCVQAEAGVIWIARAPLRELPEPIARRLVRGAIRAQGGARDLSRAHLARSLAFLRAARTGASLDLPGGLRWRAERARCALVRERSGCEARC